MLSSLLAMLAPQLVESVMVLGNPLGLCVIWSAVICLWLLHRGDSSPAYKRCLGRVALRTDRTECGING